MLRHFIAGFREAVNNPTASFSSPPKTLVPVVIMGSESSVFRFTPRLPKSLELPARCSLVVLVALPLSFLIACEPHRIFYAETSLTVRSDGSDTVLDLALW